MPDNQPVEAGTQPWTPQIAPGLFTEATDRGAVNRWKDGNWVRFNEGLPQTIGGYVTAAVTGAVVRGKVRAVLEWQSNDGNKWIAFGTSAKLYLLSAGVVYDITPLRRVISLTNPFTTTSGQAVVTVTDVGHGAEAGDYIRISGASAVGGITPDGEYS